MSAGPAGLRALFHPRSIALVGASDRSGWSAGTFGNLRGHGFPGPVHLVNPRAEIVHGEKAYPSLADVPGPVDLAFVMVPTDAVLPVLRAGAEAGIRAYVVLTSGFGETGADGARREAEVAAFAGDRGLTILGPNGNGYINAAAGITPYGLPIPPPLLRGPVGVVLQSGALASSVLTFAQARNIGVSLLVSMGNESMLSVADVVGYLVDDPGHQGDRPVPGVGAAAGEVRRRGAPGAGRGQARRRAEGRAQRPGPAHGPGPHGRAGRRRRRDGRRVPPAGHRPGPLDRGPDHHGRAARGRAAAGAAARRRHPVRRRIGDHRGPGPGRGAGAAGVRSRARSRRWPRSCPPSRRWPIRWT